VIEAAGGHGTAPARSWRNGAEDRLLLGLAAWIALFYGYAWTSLPGLPSLAGELADVPVHAGATYLAFRASRHPVLPPSDRTAWRWLALGSLCSLVGDLGYTVVLHVFGRPPFPSIADVSFVLQIPLVVMGVRLLQRGPLSRAGRLQLSLDGATTFVSLGALLWLFLLRPLAVAPDRDWLESLLAGLYPAGDCISIVMTGLGLLRRPAPVRRGVLQLLMASFVSLFAADVAYALHTLRGTTDLRHATDALWAIAAWLTAAAAWRHTRNAEVARAQGESQHVPSTGVAAMGAVVAAYGLLLWQARPLWTTPVGGLVLAAAVLALLVMARQFVALRENARLEAQQAQVATEARFRSIVQNASDIIVVVDGHGQAGYRSPSAERTLALAEGPLAPLETVVHPDDAAKGQALLERARGRPGETVRGEWRVQQKAGGWLFVEVVGTSLLDDPYVRGIVLTMRDVHERKLLEQRLAHQAFHDPLTQMGNRALLTDRLQRALAQARRDRTPVALLFVDLDDFKKVNDSLGHGAGDQALLQVAERLRGCVRPGDTAARLGGDEFAVLLEGHKDPTTVEKVAQRLLESLRRPLSLAGEEVFLTASVGVAVAATGDARAEDLLRDADFAMYGAKQGGKDRLQVFEAGLHAVVRERLGLEADLRRALDRGEMRLVYQPIVELATQRVVGAEALLRWQHAERGAIAPIDFIGIAEASDLIVSIGSWVLSEACRSAQAWPGKGPHYVAVNVSARQVQEPTFVAQVLGALQAAALPPERLVLELTESLFMVEMHRLVPRLRQLADAGVRIAIDDFGTGYSSLSRLRDLPVHIVKIDRVFAEGLRPGTEAVALSRVIVDLGRALGFDVVAEGIETADQAAALDQCGCGLAQGFYFARPMEPADLHAALERGSTTDPP
jgi:diguanylate cyclase (GGDEF)-like protein/PAS domain S-box-containing protein